MYQLFHENTLIGKIEKVDEDFPSLSGLIAVEKNLPDDIANYISYSTEDIKLLNNDGEDYVQKFESSEQEKNYNKFVDSNKWYLVDEKGIHTSIMTPIFHPDNRIVWRWEINNEV